ncbi:hypothetical protein D3C75_991850 [compost metagenome]
MAARGNDDIVCRLMIAAVQHQAGNLLTQRRGAVNTVVIQHFLALMQADTGQQTAEYFQAWARQIRRADAQM